MIPVKQTLLQWLGAGELARVLAGLTAVARATDTRTLAGEVTLLSGRYQQLRGDYRKGVIGRDDWEQGRARFTQALFDLVEALPGDLPADVLANIPPEPEMPVAGSFSWKKIGIVGAVLLALAVLAIILKPWSREVVPPKTVHITNSDSIQRTPATGSTPAAVPAPTAGAEQQGNKNPVRLPATDTVLTVQCKTNKGRLNLHYRAGETLRLYAKASFPCHLRTFYRLADRRIILLDNDRLLAAAETGRFVELGAGFTCDAPFGQEQLYVFAQTGPFPALRTEKTADGYEVVLDALPESLRKTRGFKAKYRFAEDRVDITTTE